MKLKRTEVKNRYGDIFTFTDLDNGNVLWEGNFQYHRVGFPNKYEAAYNKFVSTGGRLSFNEFKEKAHDYDDKKKEYVMGLDVVMLIESNHDVIDMVDPSGGPYLSVGQKIHGKVIKEFKHVDGGYEIILEQ